VEFEAITSVETASEPVEISVAEQAGTVTEQCEKAPIEEKKVEITHSILPQSVAPQTNASIEKSVSVAPKPQTEEEKRASRAAKFNLPKKNETVAVQEKLAARAERFGINPVAESTTMEEKKRARAERFGSKDGKDAKQTDATDAVYTTLLPSPFIDLPQDAVKAARAMRFQMGAAGNTGSVLTEMQEK
jgi:hypothetical protein